MPNFIILECDARPIIAEVVADLSPQAVAVLKITNTYNRVVGYLAECRLAGDLNNLHNDPLCIEGDEDGLNQLAARVAELEAMTLAEAA